MRRALLLLVLGSACDSAPSTDGLQHVPAIPVTDAGASDAGLEDAGDDLTARCVALGCPPVDCVEFDAGLTCGVDLAGACADAGACAEAPTASDAGWTTAYCVPTDAGWRWSASPECDDPADHCSHGNSCRSGTCAGGTPKSCPTDPCHGACLPSTGACAIEAGAGCDDGDACTTGDVCQADGSCAGRKTGSPVHRYSDAAACDWYFTDNPGAGWSDDGVAFRSAPGGAVTVKQLFDNQSLGRPLTTDPAAWASVGSFPVEVADVVTAFGSAQPGAQKLIRYRFIAGSSCQVAGWARYFSTIDAAERPGGSTVANTPPGVSTVDTDIWVCPP